jgi:hypothetical protein
MGAVLLSALISAAAGAYLATRAAFGMPSRITLEGSHQDLETLQELSARRSVADLRVAIILTSLTLVLLVVVVGISWFVMQAPSS